jgi:hypothetical protein
VRAHGVAAEAAAKAAIAAMIAQQQRR